jgi:hypothetical protein
MFDTPETRRAINAAMRNAGLRLNYTFVNDLFLTVQMPDEDTTVFNLVGGSELVWLEFLNGID